MYLERTPVVLAPICTEPPFAVGDDLIPERTARILVSMRMAVAVNLLGLPAVAVPVPGEAGAVQAVQVIGARFRERDCLVAAAAIESILGGVAPVDPAAPAMLA
jgi:amidase